MERKQNLKWLFFNEPSKHWHFEELVACSRLSRAQTNEWLKRLIKENLIKRVKQRGKMPYYIANHDSSSFRVQKRVNALLHFERTGFLEHLSSLKNAKTVIIFGSFARSDWNSDSDIDVFVYGKADGFEKGYYERKLKREIQLFQYESKKDLGRLEPSVGPKILAGIYVKGGVDPFEVSVHA